jgi:hypothetical protein
MSEPDLKRRKVENDGEDEDNDFLDLLGDDYGTTHHSPDQDEVADRLQARTEFIAK